MANVNFKRGDTATMNATAISDGLIFLNTENNKIYFDNGSTRLQFGGDTSLISSVDDADVDNAFNSSATVNLFAQKNSIVDTKANALAVTQPQIPLGCLAFKEAVGTTNISTIGDGTLSGAITTLNTNLGNKINTSAIANNVATTSAGYVLDARQGKALNDSITGNRVVLANGSITRSISNTTYTEFEVALSSAITNFKSIEVLMGVTFGTSMRYYDLIQAPTAIVVANGTNNRFRRKVYLPTFDNFIEFYYISSTKLKLHYESVSNLSGNYVCWYYIVGVKN